MWPLPPRFRTALIFYLGFIGLLVLLTQAAISSWAGLRLLALSPEFNSSAGLLPQQQRFNSAWEEWLTKAGYQPEALLRAETTQLTELHQVRTTIKAITGESTLVLPVSGSETQLVALGEAWKDLACQQGFTPTATAWGYGAAGLWIKLSYQTELRPNQPLQQVTLVQPWPGRPRQHWQLGQLFPTSAPSPTLTERPRAPLPATAPRYPSFKRRARVAIIIDDFGYDRQTSATFLQLPVKLTWAILPFTPYAAQAATAARERGWEILLHLPLEPLPQPVTPNPGPGLIKREWDRTQIEQQLDADLQNVPGVVGVNNHMGSAGTSDPHLMEELVQALKQRRLFLIDSHTTANSLAGKYAQQYGLPFGTNQVFIDNRADREYQKGQLRQLIALALRQGQAIAIGHARSETAAALQEMLPELAAAGVEIVPVSELLH